MQSPKKEEESDASSHSNEIVASTEVASPIVLAPRPSSIFKRQRFAPIQFVQQRCRYLCCTAEGLLSFVGACWSQDSGIMCQNAQAMMLSTHCWERRSLMRTCGMASEDISAAEALLEKIIIGHLQREQFVTSDGVQYGPIDHLPHAYTTFVHEGSVPPFKCQDNSDGTGLLSSLYQELALDSRIIANEAISIHKAHASTDEQARLQKAEMAALIADCDGEGGWAMAQRAHRLHMKLRCLGFLAYPRNVEMTHRYNELWKVSKWLDLLEFKA